MTILAKPHSRHPTIVMWQSNNYCKRYLLLLLLCCCDVLLLLFCLFLIYLIFLRFAIILFCQTSTTHCHFLVSWEIIAFQFYVIMSQEEYFKMHLTLHCNACMGLMGSMLNVISQILYKKDFSNGEKWVEMFLKILN